MFATLKSEFRKLLTVRSTYLITAFVFIIVSLISFFGFGYKAEAAALASPDFVREMLYGMLSLFVTFATVITILLVVHEYRYNTINYTFTLARHRLRVLVSKVIVALSYTTVVGLAVLGTAYGMSQLGLQLKDATLVSQSLPTGIIWQFAAYTWGSILVGAIIGVIVRGMVGSIVAFFLIPTVEQVASVLLKGNTKYLPFRSLESIAASSTPSPLGESLTHTAALGIFSIYLLSFGALAVWLFINRDAS